MATKTKAGTELDTAPTDEQLIAAFMARAADTATEDPAAIERRIILETLKARTFEETFAPQSLLAWTDYPDQAFQVRAVRWNESKIADGPGAYAVVDAVDIATGEAVRMACGATRCMVQLHKADTEGWLPAVLKIVAGSVTSNGYTPYHLEAVAVGK